MTSYNVFNIRLGYPVVKFSLHDFLPCYWGFGFFASIFFFKLLTHTMRN